MSQVPNLHETIDAEIWADHFIEQVKEGKIDPTDLDTVRAWFANAIMAGHDHGKGPINGDHAAYLLKQSNQKIQ